MTIAYVGPLPSPQTVNFGSKTLQLTLPAIPAGRSLILAMGSQATATAANLSVAGTASGWTVDAHAEVLSQLTTAVFSVACRTAQAAGTVTLTSDQYLLRWSVVGLLFDGLLTSSSPTDAVGVASGTSTTPTAGTSTATVQGAELVLGAATSAASTVWTPGATYTAGPTLGTTNGTADKSIFTEYRTATTTGVKTAATSTDAARQWTAAAVTYQAAAAPPSAPVSMFYAKSGALHPMVIEQARNGQLI